MLSYIKLPDVIVVGSKTGGDPARDVQVYNFSDFSSMCPETIDQIVATFPSVYVKNRGPAGIQQDVGISGAGHEQVLVLFDGIPVNDPQTGHFNMNIPVSPLAIQRIELLNGHGSASHGSGAMGGVINIVPGSDSHNSLTAYGGSNSTFGSEYLYNKARGNLKNTLSLSFRKTGDYHPETDSATYNIFNMTQYKDFKLSLAYMNKEFGAYDFYTPGWDMPSREWNELFLVSTSFKKSFSKFTLTPTVMWRRHLDRFLLKADDPDFYENNHTNDIITTQLNMKYNNFLLGIDFNNEFIDSSSMGKHSRQIVSCFSEFTYKPVNQIILSAGLRYEDILIPRISFAWWLLEGFKLRSAGGKSYRRPSFTDMYYSSPANTGNANLKSEHSTNFELGSDINPMEKLKISLTLYNNTIKDLIDWTSSQKTGPWLAENKGTLISNGINTGITYNINKSKYSLGYSYVDVEKNMNYFSKYALKYLQNRINFLIEQYLPAGLSLSINGEWGAPVNRDEESFGLLNCALKKDIGPMELFVKVDNLGNSDYSDLAGAPAPGRWFTAGINYRQ